MNFLIKQLPGCVRLALDSIGYTRADISVQVRETYTMRNGGIGRAFTCVVDLKGGYCDLKYGSWGGPNMFDNTNPVDWDATSRPIGEHTAIIQGSGGNKVHASISVHADTFTTWGNAGAVAARAEIMRKAESGDVSAQAMLVRADEAMQNGQTLAQALATTKDVLSDLEKSVLRIHCGYTSAGRKREFEDMAYKMAPDYTKRGEANRKIHTAIDTLVTKGYLKRNKAGAVQITLEGKNLVRG